MRHLTPTPAASPPPTPAAPPPPQRFFDVRFSQPMINAQICDPFEFSFIVAFSRFQAVNTFKYNCLKNFIKTLKNIPIPKVFIVYLTIF